MKVFATFVMLTALLLVGGCGNMSFIDRHWTFDKALIDKALIDKALIKVGDGWQSVDVKAWHDYEYSDMVAVETRTQVFVTHSCNVVLIKNK